MVEKTGADGKGQSFRDEKSERFGFSLRGIHSRTEGRISVLSLLATLATVVLTHLARLYRNKYWFVCTDFVGIPPRFGGFFIVRKFRQWFNRSSIADVEIPRLDCRGQKH